MDTWQAVAIGLIPSIGVGLLFWFVMRAVLRADRREREALARIDREEAAARGESGSHGADARGDSSTGTPASA